MAVLHRLASVLRFAAGGMFVLLALLAGTSAQAQMIYGVGAVGTTGTLTVVVSTSLFTVNPASGAATPACTLAAPTSANSASSLDGQVYYITRDGSPPADLYRVNPLTCVNTLVGPITGAAATPLGDITLRATHCPDGRFYAAANTTQFFEINPATGATLRTLNWTGLPTGGSGDFACTDTGDMYLIAPTVNDGTTYALFRANAASFSSVPNGSNVATTMIGSNLGLNGVPTGIAESPSGTGCAASPSPCLLVSTGGTYQTWRVNALTGSATNAGATGHGIGDLARSFPIDISFAKTVTPTVALQSQTVMYTLLASNSGPGVVSQVTVQDTLPTGVASASWACAVQTAGTATMITTSCGTTPTGSGNINNTVSLSLGGSVRYTITATLSNAFSGTLTNAGQATITTPATDPDLSNNSATVSSTVNPAAHLTIAKTNGVGTVTAGSTTNYTISVANSGPGNATNTVVTDPAADGLSCTTVSCSVASGAAVCPVSPGMSIANLQGSGVTITTFPANSSLDFLVTCLVTATGVP